MNKIFANADFVGKKIKQATWRLSSLNKKNSMINPQIFEKTVKAGIR
jgi:hypothetical protein